MQFQFTIMSIFRSIFVIVSEAYHSYKETCEIENKVSTPHTFRISIKQILNPHLQSQQRLPQGRPPVSRELQYPQLSSSSSPV